MIDDVQRFDIEITAGDKKFQEVASRTNSTFERMEKQGRKTFDNTREGATSSAAAVERFGKSVDTTSTFLERHGHALQNVVSTIASTVTAYRVASYAVAHYGDAVLGVSKAVERANIAIQIARNSGAGWLANMAPILSTASGVAMFAQVAVKAGRFTYNQAQASNDTILAASSALPFSGVYGDPLRSVGLEEKFRSYQVSRLLAQSSNMSQGDINAAMVKAYEYARQSREFRSSYEQGREPGMQSRALYKHYQGMAVNDVNALGDTRAPLDTMVETMNKLNQIKDPFERTERTREIFGDMANVILPKLNSEFTLLAANAAKSGEIIGSVGARNLDEFKRDADSVGLSIRKMLMFDIIPSMAELKTRMGVFLATYYVDMKEEFKAEVAAMDKATRSLGTKGFGGAMGTVAFPDTSDPARFREYIQSSALSTTRSRMPGVAVPNAPYLNQAAQALLEKYRGGKDYLYSERSDAESARNAAREKLLSGYNYTTDAKTGALVPVPLSEMERAHYAETLARESKRYDARDTQIKALDKQDEDADTAKRMSRGMSRHQLMGGMRAEAEARMGAAGRDPLARLFAQEYTRTEAESRFIDENNVVHRLTFSPSTMKKMEEALKLQAREIIRRVQDEVRDMQTEFLVYMQGVNKATALRALEMEGTRFDSIEPAVKNARALATGRAQLGIEIASITGERDLKQRDIQRKYEERRQELQAALTQAHTPTQRALAEEAIHAEIDKYVEQMTQTGKRAEEAITAATETYAIAIAKATQQLREETLKISQEIEQKGFEFSGSRLGVERGTRQREIELRESRTFDLDPRRAADRKVQVEREKLNIEVEYMDKLGKFHDQEIDRRYNREKVGLLHALSSAPVEQHQELLDKIGKLEEEAEQERRQRVMRTNDDILAAQQDSAIRQAQIIRGYYEKQFDTIKEAAGHLFDAALTGAKGFGDALKHILINAALTPVREAVSNTVASILTGRGGVTPGPGGSTFRALPGSMGSVEGGSGMLSGVLHGVTTISDSNSSVAQSFRARIAAARTPAERKALEGMLDEIEYGGARDVTSPAVAQLGIGRGMLALGGMYGAKGLLGAKAAQWGAWLFGGNTKPGLDDEPYSALYGGSGERLGVTARPPGGILNLRRLPELFEHMTQGVQPPIGQQRQSREPIYYPRSSEDGTAPVIDLGGVMSGGANTYKPISWSMGLDRLFGAPGGTSGFAGPVTGYGDFGGEASGASASGGRKQPSLMSRAMGMAGLGGFSLKGAWSTFKGNLESLGNIGYGPKGGDFGGEVAGSYRGIGGMKGGALLAGGSMLAMDGLMGKRAGTWLGIAEGTAGGAMIGAKFGGPIGALIGGAVGFGIGLGEKLAGVESKENQAKRLVREIYGVNIDNGLASQIVEVARSKYSGHVSMAIRDPDVRNLLELYAAGTGQKIPMSAATPRAGSLVESGGQLFQAPTYRYGQGYVHQSSLATSAGLSTSGVWPSVGGAPLVQLIVGGKGASDFFSGQVMTPDAVQTKYQQSQAASNGRLKNAALTRSPGLVVA